MTLLPIVARELRIGARRIGPRWTRVVLVALAVLMSLNIVMVQSPAAGSSRVGREVFNALVVMGFLLASAAFILTADSVSSERREGTLGLLFLTDLKGHDVIFGKLATSGLNACFVLVGLAPVLMLPVFLGGVLWAEVARMVLVLSVTMFLAMAVGVWVSVRSARQFSTVAASLVVLALIFFGPLFIGNVGLGNLRGFVMALSPIRAALRGHEMVYDSEPREFWISIASVHALSWLLVFFAWRRLVKNWREEFARRSRNVLAARRVARRVRMQGATDEAMKMFFHSFAPVACAVMRIPGQRMMAALAGLLGFLASFLGLVFGLLSPALGMGIGQVLRFASLGMFAWLAGRFFVEAMKSGELELLMSTPAGARGILRDQWLALLRLLRTALVLVVMGAIFSAARFVAADAAGPLGLVIAVATIANAALSVFAVCWMGMRFGLNTLRPIGVVAWTLGLVEGAPLVVFLLGYMVLSQGGGGGMEFYWYVLVPLLQIAKNFFFIWWAQERLCGELRCRPVFMKKFSSLAGAVGDDFAEARKWIPGVRS